MGTQLNGKWIHRSFRNDLTAPPGSAGAGGPVLAAPWAPPGDFEVTTSDTGAVSGKLHFPRGIDLTVTGQVSEALAAGSPVPWPQPASVELTAVVGTTEYRLRGWFIPGSNVIAGTVLAVKDDLAKAPDGTLGSWVLTKEI